MKAKNLYEVHFIVDRAVLNDILAYVEDHGHVLLMKPYEARPGAAPINVRSTPRRSRNSSVTGNRVDDRILQRLGTVGHLTAETAGDYITDFGYNRISAAPALSRLANEGLTVKVEGVAPTCYNLTQKGEARLRELNSKGSADPDDRRVPRSTP